MADPFAALNKACTKTLGTAVSYQQGTADPVTIRCVVMKDSDEEQHQGGLYMRVFANLSDFPSSPDHGDLVTIDEVTYTVYEVLIDAVGGVNMRIRAAA